MSSTSGRKRKLEDITREGEDCNDEEETKWQAPPKKRHKKCAPKKMTKEDDSTYVYAVYSREEFLNIDKAPPDPWFSYVVRDTKSHSLFSSAKEANKCGKDIFKRNEPSSEAADEDGETVSDDGAERNKKSKDELLFDRKHKPIRTDDREQDENKAYTQFHCWVEKKRVLHKY
eukprot:74700_1